MPNLIEAKEAAGVLRNDRHEDRLPTSGHKPDFADYIEGYVAKPTVVAKKPSTPGLLPHFLMSRTTGDR